MYRYHRDNGDDTYLLFTHCTCSTEQRIIAHIPARPTMYMCMRCEALRAARLWNARRGDVCHHCMESMLHAACLRHTAYGAHHTVPVLPSRTGRNARSQVWLHDCVSSCYICMESHRQTSEHKLRATATPYSLTGPQHLGPRPPTCVLVHTGKPEGVPACTSTTGTTN